MNQINAPALGGSDSAHAQRQRLYEWLKTHGRIDTLAARRDLDILMPAARVWELKHRFGKLISKVWVDRPTDCGKVHRIAMYVMEGTQ